jgi:hypothetical protein
MAVVYRDHSINIESEHGQDKILVGLNYLLG